MPRGGARAGAGRKPLPDQEIAALVEALRPVKVGRRGYTGTDRYRDFNSVLHRTEAGRRVLSQIIDLCEGPIVTEVELGNHALLATRAWGRRIATMILSWASIPPVVSQGEKLLSALSKTKPRMETDA